MRYSIEPRFRKYVEGYGFLSFAKNVGNKYGTKLMDTATKTGMDAAKIASKRVVQKNAEATGKNVEEAYKKIIDMSNNSDYTTGNLLDFAYYKKHYRLIAVDLSKQTKLKDPEQINFISKLLRNTGATMFFIIETTRRNYF